MQTFRPLGPILAACVLVAGPLSTAALAARPAATRMTLALTGVTGADPAVATAVYRAFRDKVADQPRFDVVDQDDGRLQQAFRMTPFGETGMLNRQAAPQVGALLGTGYLMFIDCQNPDVVFEPGSTRSRYGKFKAVLTTTVRFVNTRTGEALSAFTCRGSGSNRNRDEAVTEAIDHLAKELLLSTLDAFGLKGTIVARSGGDVTVDLGLTAGLRPDTSFDVIRDVNGLHQTVGMIRIDDVGPETARGVVKQGYWAIRVGDRLEENVRPGMPLVFGATYEYLPLQGAPGGYKSGLFPPLSYSSLFGISARLPELFDDHFGMALNTGYLALQGLGLGGLLFDFNGTFRWEPIPELLAVDVHLGPTLAVFWQDRANFDPSALTVRTFDTPGAAGLGANTGITGVLALGPNLRLRAGIGYRIMTPTNSWSIDSNRYYWSSYTFKDPTQIAYPVLNLGGPTFQAGIEGQF